MSMLDPNSSNTWMQPKNKPAEIIKTIAKNSSIFIKESLSPAYCTLKPKNTNPQPRYLARSTSHAAQGPSGTIQKKTHISP